MESRIEINDSEDITNSGMSKMGSSKLRKLLSSDACQEKDYNINFKNEIPETIVVKCEPPESLSENEDDLLTLEYDLNNYTNENSNYADNLITGNNRDNPKKDENISEHKPNLKAEEILKSIKRLIKQRKIDIDDQQTVCDVCHKVFKSPSRLLRHMRTHTGERPYHCTLCTRTFVSYNGLKMHVEGHTGEYKFTCPVCHGKFPKESNLKSHMKIHTGEKPYACDKCDKKFATSSHLNIHQSVHTKERPYCCALCSKTFKSKNTLVDHMRIHTDRLHTCEICGKGFTKNCVLVRHMKTHSDEKPYMCDVCPLRLLKQEKILKFMHQYILIKDLTSANTVTSLLKTA
ncbi:hypothetical protein L9F63_010557 [Diploptera punctata]|uniref:C2H2-type domain-containing protein n=1 Tax=Diploptera punctata TaxID=6984 RepID=A0AAD8EQI6_DIPPU|nr:hypothetical protein L9F63_010557 [Diploptera punctata]